MKEEHGRSLDTAALLLRKTDFGDSDLVLQFFTEALGRVSVMARAARASKRRFAGGLEPFHGLVLQLDPPHRGELYRLREARIEIPRLSVVSNLIALDIAGRALAWVRSTTVPRTPEHSVYQACSRLLSTLDEHPPPSVVGGEALLAEFGLFLLTALGWALELQRCVRCGRVCPDQAPATLDAKHGGLVCRRCGGGKHRINSDLRRRMILAQSGEHTELLAEDAQSVLDIVEATLLAHPGVETL